MASAIYDREAFFQKYSQMDRSVKGLQGAGEWPALEKMLPDFEGKTVLDLGCGFGWHCRHAVQHGAAQVTGVDISKKMLEKAQTLNGGPRITYMLCSIEDAAFQPEAFDVAFSSLAFHYIADFKALSAKVFGWLKKGGAFVFSVEHPVFTAEGSQQWVHGADGKPLYWPVDRYFIEGARTATFLGETMTKYHRTLTTYVEDLRGAGFELTGLAEPQPVPETLDTVPGMRDELRRPMMLILSCRKPLS